MAIDKGFTGFQILPDVLVRGQNRLGLSNAEMVVLLNILMHWWTKDHLPHPRPEVIARRMGASKRTIERQLENLEERGLIRRLPPEKSENSPAIRRFDLGGLISALQELANEMRAYDGAYEKLD